MARVHLRLSDAEFYRLTPRQLQLLIRRHKEQSRHNELLTGIIASTVANCLGTSKEALQPKHFMPSEWNKPEPKPDEETERSRVATSTRSVFEELAKQTNKKK